MMEKWSKINLTSVTGRNVFWTMTINLLKAGCAALLAWVAARSFGPEGIGLLMLLRTSMSILCLILSAGMPLAVTYYVASKKYPIEDIALSLIVFSLFASAITFGLWLLGSPFLHQRYFPFLTPHQILLAGLLAPMILGNQMASRLLQGKQNYLAANSILMAADLAILITLWSLVLLQPKPDYRLILEAVLIGEGMSFLLGLGLVMRLGIRPRLRLHFPFLREALSYGIRGQIGAIVNIMNYRLDLLILGFFATPAVVGLYGLASKFAEVLRVLPNAVAFVYMPRFGKRAFAEAARMAEETFYLLMMINLGLVVAAALLGKILILTFFGPSFQPAVLPFYILLLGMAAQGGNGALSAFHNGTGNPEYSTYAVGLAFLVTLVFDLLLIPPYGATGAAIASSLSYATIALALLFFFSRNTGRAFGRFKLWQWNMTKP